eukprot:jgi/Tetstr1/464069/TSEL_008874.t1
MRIVVYGYDYCPYTRNAAALAGVPIVEARILTECDPRDRVLSPLLKEVRKAKHRTIPMCFDMHRRKEARFVGGYDQLVPYLEARGKRRAGGAKG